MVEQNVVLGVITNFLAALCFGSTYVPVRFFATGDGIYFQWLNSIGQFLVGIVVYLLCGCPPFAPLVMVSGVVYALGNALTIFIMNGIGMAVGSLLWNTCACLVGWGVSRFGLFGTQVQEPVSNALNIVGVLLVCVGGFFFVPIKYHRKAVRPAPSQYPKDEKTDLDEQKPISLTKRVVSILLCFVAGTFYGNTLTATNYVIENHLGPPEAHANFFAHTVGTLVTATTVFVIYSGLKRNRPFVNPEITLPSLLSGVIYGIGACSLFIACQHLGQVVAFPISSRTTGVVISLWAVFLFKEIKGKWNIIALVSGIFTTLVGVVFISLSRIQF